MGSNLAKINLASWYVGSSAFCFWQNSKAFCD